MSKSSIEGYFLTSRFTGLVTLAGELYDRSDRYALRPIVRRMSYAPLGGRYLIQIMDNMKAKQKIEKNIILEHSVQIKTTPETIWKFWTELEQNYTIWHPKDHILFKWTEGKPLEVGSKFYSEQYMGREKIKYTGEISESIENEKITIQFSFPMSLTVKKIQWILKTEGEYTTFTAITYLQFGWIFRALFPKKILKLIEDQNEHVAFEGENLKEILENQEDNNPITQ